MAIQNNNRAMIDRPMWEQLMFAPVTGVAGTNLADDGKRYLYSYFQTSTTAAQFWRYDTWSDMWQQLATPPTQTGTVANMVYTDAMGDQINGKSFGAIYLFVGNGTVCYFYKFNIATNAWSANLGTVNIPATFATDAYLMYPGPGRNNYETGYHTGVLRTITNTSTVAVGATSIPVSATAEAMAIGTRLRFGTFTISVSSAVSQGANSIAVNALSDGIASGVELSLGSGYSVTTTSAVAAGATSIPVYIVPCNLNVGDIFTVERFVVLTVAAAASATSLTVSACMYNIPIITDALYYGNMYLIGNNATVMYRYNKGANAWATTSANAGNPAIPAMTGTAGAGCALKWLPVYMKDKLYYLRGNGSSSAYTYDLVTNTWAGVTYYPNTETFTTGTSVASRSVNGKQSSLLIQKDATYRIYEVDLANNRLEPKMTQWLCPGSTAVVGDKSCCITSPDGVEYYYNLLHSSTGFVRAALLDS